MKTVKRIPIKGCNNLRDLGGYPCTNGYSKWNTCYRCDLPLCDEKGFQELYENWNVKCIIDLRSTAEYQMQSYMVDTRIKYLHIPLIKEDHVDIQAMQAFKSSMADSYLGMCKTSGENIVKILSEIAHAITQGAVIFHCTAGKDRTGIISFFLLSLLGVNSVDIMADYQVSSTYNFYGSSEHNTLLKELANSENAWMHSQPETLGALFDYFASVDMIEYLISNGMKKDDIQTIYQYFTES